MGCGGREGDGASPVCRTTHLRPLGLDAAEAVGPVDDGVFGDHLVGVDVTAGPDDAAAGQDHVPADKRWQKERGIPVRVVRAVRLNPAPPNTNATSCSEPEPAQPSSHQGSDTRGFCVTIAALPQAAVRPQLQQDATTSSSTVPSVYKRKISQGPRQ